MYLSISFGTQQISIGKKPNAGEKVYEEKKELTPEELLRIGNEYYYDKNYIEAAKYFKKSAEQGEVDAQLFLELCYLIGQGVSQEDTEAVKWYRKAADKGHEKAKKALERLRKSK